MNSNDKLNELLKKPQINGKELGQIIVNSLARTFSKFDGEAIKQAERLLKTPKQRRIYNDYLVLSNVMIRFYNHYELWRMEGILKAAGLCSTISIVRASEIIQTLNPDQAKLTGINGIEKLQLTEKKLIKVKKSFDISTRKLTSFNKIIELIAKEYDVEISGLKKCCISIIKDSINYSRQRTALINELKQRKNQSAKIKIVNKHFKPIIPTICTDESLAKARKMLKNRNADLGDNIRDILAMLTDKQVLKS